MQKSIVPFFFSSKNKVNVNNKKKRINQRIIIRNDTLILYHHRNGNSASFDSCLNTIEEQAFIYFCFSIFKLNPNKSLYLGFGGMVHWNKPKRGGPAVYCQARPWKSKRPFWTKLKSYFFIFFFFYLRYLFRVLYF